MRSSPNLRAPGRAGERAAELAEKLGCEVFEHQSNLRLAQPALCGALGDVAKLLREYGGRWNSADKALLFPSWSALEVVLAAILKEQGAQP